MTFILSMRGFGLHGGWASGKGGSSLTMGSGSGSTPPSYTPALQFNDARNSMYVPAIAF